MSEIKIHVYEAMRKKKVLLYYGTSATLSWKQCHFIL